MSTLLFGMLFFAVKDVSIKGAPFSPCAIFGLPNEKEKLQRERLHSRCNAAEFHPCVPMTEAPNTFEMEWKKNQFCFLARIRIKMKRRESTNKFLLFLLIATALKT